MRIIVNGQQAFGKAVLERLLERGEEVVGVYCGPDKEGRPEDPIKTTAVEHGIPVFQPRSFRKPEVWEQMRELAPDLGVMAYVTLFVPDEALNLPSLGTIQYHPSLLPLHKGPSSINWPIIFGAKKTGLSIFWPDNGLDTGPILLQKEVPIGPDDTLGTIYFNHLFPMGVEAMMESVDLVREGKAPKVAQDPDAGTYEGWCKAEDGQIDWSKPTADVYNLIRGCNPQPGAWTTFNGNKVLIFDSAVSTDASSGAKTGEVLAVTETGLSVATADGAIVVSRVRADGAKIAASEFAANANIVPGTVLG
jgi:methionyl-tRNA formyltransferase